MPRRKKVSDKSLAVAIANIRSKRIGDGATVGEIAERSGIRRETLSRLENGRIKNPEWETLSKYAEAVGMKLELSIGKGKK